MPVRDILTMCRCHTDDRLLHKSPLLHVTPAPRPPPPAPGACDADEHRLISTVLSSRCFLVHHALLPKISNPGSALQHLYLWHAGSLRKVAGRGRVGRVFAGIFMGFSLLPSFPLAISPSSSTIQHRASAHPSLKRLGRDRDRPSALCPGRPCRRPGRRGRLAARRRVRPGSRPAGCSAAAP